MSGNKKQKQIRKEAQRNDPVHWEQSWIEQILPTIKEFVGRSSSLRYLREIDVEDRMNWVFGSDLDIEHAKRRIVITEWLVPVFNGKPMVYMDEVNGVLNSNMRAYKFILRYDHLQAAARDATQRNGEVNIGRYYLPEMVLVPGDKGWEERLDAIDRLGSQIVDRALAEFDLLLNKLVNSYGALSDDGHYVGLRLWYNTEENLLQLVTHKRHALDVIESKEGEIDYIDLNGINIDDVNFSIENSKLDVPGNIRSAVARHVAEHNDWKRVTKPSPEAYARFSGDLADYLMSVSEEVYKRACDAVPVDTKVDFEYNLTNGGLDASYQIPGVIPADAEPGTTAEPIKVDIELAREDRAAILIVAGRIEPDMWYHVQADYLRRFLMTYGKGDVIVTNTVLSQA